MGQTNVVRVRSDSTDSPKIHRRAKRRAVNRLSGLSEESGQRKEVEWESCRQGAAELVLLWVGFCVKGIVGYTDSNSAARVTTHCCMRLAVVPLLLPSASSQAAQRRGR